MTDHPDPIETLVIAALRVAAIRYEPGHMRGTTLDLYLPDHGVYIECKQFYTDRISRQLQQAPDVIVIQGRNAAVAFADMITRETER